MGDTPHPPLHDLRVVDLSRGIAGAYATRMLADAGARVLRVEPASGNPLRRWTASGRDLAGESSALFRFLDASKQSWIGSLGDDAVADLLAEADLVFEDLGPEAPEREHLRALHPGLVWVSISPWGLQGPYADRPASELVVQAESGSVAGRGLRHGEPFMAGGRITEWVAGSYAAVAGLAATRRVAASGVGEHVDLSMLEIATLTMTLFTDLSHSLAGRPALKSPQRSVEIPSIEPTADGWIGFNTNSRQQFEDFLLLIERPDLMGDSELAMIVGRIRRMEEWNGIVRDWTRRHTTEEIVERAALLRIPVAPVHDGASVIENEHFRARGVFGPNPAGGFLEPRVPYRIAGVELAPRRPAPAPGEHSDPPFPPRTSERHDAPADPALPLAGVRVLDATGWWAGPSASHVLACLGAEVIHLESIQRPDGSRMFTGRAAAKESWWERSPLFLSVNANKKSLTLNLQDDEGLELCRRLISECDVVMENFSPRVFENFGLDWEPLHAMSPRTILVRMPAFGLDGPWRDRVGFAQTMEQVTGLAWMTGHRDDQPRVQSGPCDPNAGMHAAFAALVALHEREHSGVGRLIECPMVESALSAAAEMIVEASAYGHLMERDGNRAPWAAPQGLYRAHGEEQWLALSVETPQQWHSLVEVLGRPAWALDPSLENLAGRSAAHDDIDAELRRFVAGRELDDLIEELVAAGVPAGRVVDGRLASLHPQHHARGFYESVSHSVAGRHPISGLPFRMASRSRWIRTPSPTMGQHNREILGTLLGLDADRIDALEKRGVLGDRPLGV